MTTGKIAAIRLLGDTLPSITAIAKRLRTSRVTVRKHLSPAQRARLAVESAKLQQRGASKGGNASAKLRAERARLRATPRGLSPMARGIVECEELMRGGVLNAHRIVRLCDVSLATAKRDLLVLETVLPVRREAGRVWLEAKHLNGQPLNHTEEE